MNGKRVTTFGALTALVALAAFGVQERSVAEPDMPSAKTAIPVEVTAPEAAKAVETPAPVAPEAKPVSVPYKIEAPKVEKMTVLPDGKVLIENKKVTLRYANGKTEDRYVKITATPVQKPVQKVMRKKPQPQ